VNDEKNEKGFEDFIGNVFVFVFVLSVLRKTAKVS
jgi:hypothetical protein